MLIRWLIALGSFQVCLLDNAAAQNVSPTSYVQPNSTGFLLQHGFEALLVQPYGYDRFRVRAWPFRPPTGDEISFIYDPPLEGYESGSAHGMEYDTKHDGNATIALQNGHTIVRTFGPDGSANRLAFYRVESDGSETLLINEYSPAHAVNSRYYSWGSTGSEFSAEFSFGATPDEQIYGTGTQQDHAVNKKGSAYHERTAIYEL